MIRVADNLQIIDPAIQRAVDERNPRPIQNVVHKCVAAGAQAIDINSGPLPREAADRMRFLVESVQAETDLPILLDTTNPEAVAAGLSASVNRTIINGFSMEQRKIDAILPLARKHDVEIVGYLLYPNGHVPPDEAGRLEMALQLHAAFRQTGLPDERLIIDPIVAPVIWENGHLQDMAVISVIRHLPDLLGFPVRTIAGISNLTTGRGPMAKKRLLEAAYLPMLAASGLSFALMNMFHEQTVAVAHACQALMDSKIFVYETVPT